MSNTVATGASLKPGEFITSPNGKYKAELQTDGNLVVSGPTGPAWGTMTYNQPVATADMQADGNLVLYTAEHGVVWASNTEGSGAHLVIQDDRNLVVYAADGSTVLWSPNCYVTDEDKAAEAKLEADAAAAAAAPPPAAPAAPAAPEPRRYTVKPGDNLSHIAREFYGDANAYHRIAEANGIANPDLIHPGQELIIP
jgi:LysM repeat protein